MDLIDVEACLLGGYSQGYTAYYLLQDQQSGRRTGRIVLADRQTWLVEQDDDYLMLNGPRAGEIRLGRGRYQRGPAVPLGIPDSPAAFLRPRHAPIWGSPHHDWRLTGPVEPDEETATLPLAHVTDTGLIGQFTADLRLGMILDLKIPGRRTTLTGIDHTISAADQRLLRRVS